MKIGGGGKKGDKKRVGGHRHTVIPLPLHSRCAFKIHSGSQHDPLGNPSVYVVGPYITSVYGNVQLTETTCRPEENSRQGTTTLIHTVLILSVAEVGRATSYNECRCAFSAPASLLIRQPRTGMRQITNQCILARFSKAECCRCTAALVGDPRRPVMKWTETSSG